MSSSKKVVLIGHFGVGKSSLVRRFVQNTFSDSYIVTIGVHILKKEIQLNGSNITLIIWDIEGKDDFKKVRPSYLLGTSGFIYVIDPTRPQTYERFNEEKEFIVSNYPTAQLVTVANKIDVIELDDFKIELETRAIEIDFFASAKTGNEVEKVFLNLASKMI